MVVGKPSPFILDQLCAAHGLKKERCLVVGDRLDTDIEWGIQNGAATLLVLTGAQDRRHAMRTWVQSAVMDWLISDGMHTKGLDM